MVHCSLFIEGRVKHSSMVEEGNVLFNDALNTFYLWLYGIRHMVKDHSDSERENPLPPHGLLFPISSKGSFICTIPQTGQHIPRPLLHQSWSTGWNVLLRDILCLTYKLKKPKNFPRLLFFQEVGFYHYTLEHLLTVV